jgi:hypothetical protein
VSLPRISDGSGCSSPSGEVRGAEQGLDDRGTALCLPVLGKSKHENLAAWARATQWDGPGGRTSSANQAFAARGYRGASFANIAESVGLSQPGLLHHLPSKEDLLWEVLRLKHERDRERMQGMAAERDSHLDALLDLARQNGRSPGLVRMFTVLAAELLEADHPGHEPFRERYRELRQSIAARLAEEQRHGRIASGLDVDLLAP